MTRKLHTDSLGEDSEIMESRTFMLFETSTEPVPGNHTEAC